MHNLSIEQRTLQTQIIVEANSFEIHSLWQKYNTLPDLKIYLDGDGVTVGYINNLPVVISRRWWSINGVVVLFWHATSRMVDYDLIDDWFKQQYPILHQNSLLHRINYRYDAENFINAIHQIACISDKKIN